MKIRGIPSKSDPLVLLPVYAGISPYLRRVLPQTDAHAPPPGGVALVPCPVSVPASSLPPAELDARIARYAARAARRLPLFGVGRRAAPEPEVACMGCGAVPPKRSYLHRFGWLVRTSQSDGVRLAETYCPECRP